MIKKNKTDQLDNKDNLQQELQEKFLRAVADYQNLEKRVEREKDNFVKFANSILILKLLPILDNLERAQNHLKDPGLDLVVKQFQEAVQSEGVSEIKAQGTEFNPEHHEAISESDGERGKVIEVVEKGYRLGDKIIRPAKVKVGSGVAQTDKQK